MIIKIKIPNTIITHHHANITAEFDLLSYII